jgi:hypothetical protein
MGTETNNLLETALKYLRLGWSVIPLGRNKKPLLPEWTTYQRRVATEKEVRQWWGKWPNANIGVVTGAISGLVVLDADTDEATEYIQQKGMPPTPQAITGKGTHFYLKHPGRNVTNKVNGEIGLDVRGDGGYVMAPPSIHPNGKRYEWTPFLNPWDAGLEGMSPWMIEYCNQSSRPKGGKDERGWQTEALRGVGKGERNQTAARLAGRYIAKGMDDEEVVEVLLTWNQNNDPPLPKDEITRTVKSVRATHERKRIPEESAGQFPDVMGGLAGDFANLYSSCLEVPKHFFFISCLVCLGILLAGRLTLKSEIAPQPRLYVVLLGESADDRKSTALTKTTEFFREAVQRGFYICYGVGSAEGLQKRMEENSNLLLCFDEFKQFVGKCKIDSSVLLPCVNTLFESNRYESRTKTTDIKLEDAYLSLLAASTIQTYENTWTSQFTDIGFNNRLFLVPGSGEKKFSFPSKVPDSEKYELRQRVGEILRLVPEDGLELDITPEAKELYHNWYMTLERSVHTKRLDTYAMRLMSLLAVNELKTEVDEATVRKSIALCDWQLEVRRLHDPIDAENNIAKMEEKIRRQLRNGAKTDRELKQRTNANRQGLWFFGMALNNLRNANEVTWDRETKRWKQMAGG